MATSTLSVSRPPDFRAQFRDGREQETRRLLEDIDEDILALGAEAAQAWATLVLLWWLRGGAWALECARTTAGMLARPPHRAAAAGSALGRLTSR